MKEINVLSLFDGIACARVALDRAGIPVKNYYRSEIDKYANAVAEKNYKDMISLGNVMDYEDWDIDFSKIDLLIGGSPCFEKDALVYTKEGYKEIRDIKVGDMVLTHKNRYRKVLRVGAKIASTVKIEGVHFVSFRATLNHPFPTKTEIYPGHLSKEKKREVKDFEVGKTFLAKHLFKSFESLDGEGFDEEDLDFLTEFEKNSCIDRLKEGKEWVGIDRIGDLKEHRMVYNIEVEEDHSYTVNDILTYNCQGFSNAGKGLNFDDERSKLFFEYVEILNKIKEENPNVKFVLENVKMKKEWQEIISSFLGVEPIEINSSLVSGQNRRRLYWTNIEGVEQPEDKGILLKDICHETYDMDDVMKEGWIKWFYERQEKLLKKGYVRIGGEKSGTLMARGYDSWNGTFMFEELFKLTIPIEKTIEILDRETKRGKIAVIGNGGQGERIYLINNKSVTISALGGGRGAKTGLYLMPVLTPDRAKCRQNGRRIGENKAYTLTVVDRHGIITEGYIRKLSPIECERLQTLPDNYTKATLNDKEISNSQRYKMLGNGFTVDVIAHILKYLKEEK